MGSENKNGKVPLISKIAYAVSYTHLDVYKRQDVYISNGKPAEYRPHFTYHGFRYVRVICDAPVKPEDFTEMCIRDSSYRARQ